MTSYGPDEWFWAMFEPTWTWPNFTFGQLFMWIGANNDKNRWIFWKKSQCGANQNSKLHRNSK